MISLLLWRMHPNPVSGLAPGAPLVLFIPIALLLN